jgi:endoglycosylceramidase
MTSWQYWHYCACDDPTTSGPGVQALVIDARRPPRGANVNRAKLLTLARPYPRAVAGRPRSYGFDPATRQFALVYSTRAAQRGELGRRLDRGVKTEIFLPKIQYPNGYRVQVSGARVVSDPGARVLKLERHRGADSVSAAVAPRG